MIDLAPPVEPAPAGALDPNSVIELYGRARAGLRVLLVCSHAEPRRCHRHEALALPIAQDAANYAQGAGRRASSTRSSPST